MKIHELKTEALYFDAVERGEKTFEVRRNDRAFQTGDILDLIKLNESGKGYARPADGGPGKVILRKRITYLLQGGQFGIEPAFCVLGLGPVSAEPFVQP